MCFWVLFQVKSLAFFNKVINRGKLPDAKKISTDILSV